MSEKRWQPVECQCSKRSKTPIQHTASVGGEAMAVCTVPFNFTPVLFTGTRPGESVTVLVSTELASNLASLNRFTILAVLGEKDSQGVDVRVEESNHNALDKVLPSIREEGTLNYGTSTLSIEELLGCSSREILEKEDDLNQG